jgi:hypothetical protein
MRQLTMAFLFCLASSIANAEPFPSSKKVICDQLPVVLETLANKFEEKLVWIGRDIQDGTTYLLTVNPKDQTWTQIQSDGKIACILGVGTGSTIQLGQPV